MLALESNLENLFVDALSINNLLETSSTSLNRIVLVKYGWLHLAVTYPDNSVHNFLVLTSNENFLHTAEINLPDGINRLKDMIDADGKVEVANDLVRLDMYNEEFIAGGLAKEAIQLRNQLFAINPGTQDAFERLFGQVSAPFAISASQNKVFLLV